MGDEHWVPHSFSHGSDRDIYIAGRPALDHPRKTVEGAKQQKVARLVEEYQQLEFSA